MWILTKKLHTSAYAQDTKELGLDLEAFCQTCEKSLTWRGKDSLSRTWLQRWKRESWMQHLSSRTLSNSLTESFVDAWTSSLADSRVSHSQLLESVKLLKTPDTSSPTSQTESESANLELFSLKTYKESSVARQPTENQFSSMSSEHWKDWVIEQRQEYSQRKKSARLIRESESSSWLTTTTRDWKDTMNTVPPCIGKTRGLTLGNAVAKELQNWSTPTVMDTANIQKPRKKNPSGGQKPPLCQEVKDAVETHEQKWATPNVCGNHNRKGASKTSGDGLSTQVKNWATPNTMDHMDQRSPEALQRQFETTRKGRTAPANLREQIHPQNWPTPTTAEGTKIGNQPNFGQVGLSNHPSIVGQPDRAKLNKSGKNQESWPTPRANKVHPEITEKNREHLANRKKANLEEDIAGHCGKATGKLNPSWVEHLMGLPAGWTDLGSWETE